MLRSVRLVGVISDTSASHMMLSRITYVITLDFFFFFSSRRRHTRSLCDWSSDVCSSDLPDNPETLNVLHKAVNDFIRWTGQIPSVVYVSRKHKEEMRLWGFTCYYATLGPRSEEHTSELQSHSDLVCRLLLEKKKKSK